MAIEWLAGNRLRGTSTERTSTSGFSTTTAIEGGWKEVGRTTLGSDTSTIDVSSLSDKRYYMILADYNISSGNGNPYLRLNSDTSQSYALRYSGNGGADSTGVSNTDRGFYASVSGYNTLPYFEVNYFANKSTKEKIGIGYTAHQNTAGAGNTPNRAERAMKHVQTSNPITSVNYWNQSGSGNFASGSEVVVLGYDPDDTHTDNFWEQLADVSLSSTSDTLSSGTITAKKYLWVQYYTKNSGNVETKCRFNSDSGSNYAFRWSEDGGSDVTYTSQTECDRWIFASKPSFRNFFIVNNASNEKLITGHVMSPNTAGAGTAPARAEFASKWTNTSDQITNITVNNTGTGDMDTGSFIKVWGSN